MKYRIEKEYSLKSSLTRIVVNKNEFARQYLSELSLSLNRENVDKVVADFEALYPNVWIKRAIYKVKSLSLLRMLFVTEIVFQGFDPEDMEAHSLILNELDIE